MREKENEKIQRQYPHGNQKGKEGVTAKKRVESNGTQNFLNGMERGNTMRNSIFPEKRTGFNHESVPEGMIKARRATALGYFQVYEPMRAITKAGFLQYPEVKTPVFVQFSKAAATGISREVIEFSVKFHTDEGNCDLVGYNIPVSLLQDAQKFPYLVQPIKPKPGNGVPQVSTPHDTFWESISLIPESVHMMMWMMSDRALPKSYRTMEGFGLNTFRFINDSGRSTFVKLHWKPLLGMHGMLWDEARKISDKNPDFHQQDLWEAIESGNHPEFELGIQMIAEEDIYKFDFNILDPTKVIPEEIKPVIKIGKMVLNKNPGNFSPETGQITFHPKNVVPGIDVGNHPLQQEKLFSYLDTQLIHSGDSKFQKKSMNGSPSLALNNQRNGLKLQGVDKGKKTRVQDKRFNDFFSQATFFYNSQTPIEKKHMVNAFSFELEKVKREKTRKKIVHLLAQVDEELAKKVALGLNMTFSPKLEELMNKDIPVGASEKQAFIKGMAQHRFWERETAFMKE